MIAEKAAINEFFARLIAAADAQILIDPDKLEQFLGIQLRFEPDAEFDGIHFRVAEIRTGLKYFDSEPKRPRLAYRQKRFEGIDLLHAEIYINVLCKSPFPQIEDLFGEGEPGLHPHGTGYTTYRHASPGEKSGVEATYYTDCSLSITAWQWNR